MNNAQNNKGFLQSSSATLRNSILDNIANHYGVTRDVIYQELTTGTPEDVMEYVTVDRPAVHFMYKAYMGLKTHPLASDNLSAVFDISRVCDDYIGANVVNSNATTGNILTLGRTGYSPANVIGESSDRNVSAQFTLELGFESATSATADPTETLPQSPAETTTLFAFRDEFQNYGDAYARGDGSFQPTAATDNFLSTAPNLGRESTLTFGDAREHRIGIDQASVLAWGMQSSDAEYVVVRGYEADGTIINTAVLDIDVIGGDTTPSTDSQAVQFIGVGPANLSDHAAAAFNTQLADIFSDVNLSYYEVYLSEFASVLVANQVSVVHRFTIDNGCSKYPPPSASFPEPSRGMGYVQLRPAQRGEPAQYSTQPIQPPTRELGQRDRPHRLEL